MQSAFLWGYTATTLLGGTLADKYGGKIVLAVGIAWFSAASLLLPALLTGPVIAAGLTVPAVLFSRCVCIPRLLCQMTTSVASCIMLFCGPFPPALALFYLRVSRRPNSSCTLRPCFRLFCFITVSPSPPFCSRMVGRGWTFKRHGRYRVNNI